MITEKNTIIKLIIIQWLEYTFMKRPNKKSMARKSISHTRRKDNCKTEHNKHILWDAKKQGCRPIAISAK